MSLPVSVGLTPEISYHSERHLSEEDESEE